MPTRIKICGLTREQDIESAVQAGADAIGLVFYPASKRYITPERGALLRRHIPPFVSTVALLVNASTDETKKILDIVRPDLLQFHGDETVQACEYYQHPYLRAFRIGAPGLQTSQEILDTCLNFNQAAGWLFDSYDVNYGGSGKIFDHCLLSKVVVHLHARPLILAGGLTTATVGQYIRALRPWAVDVSSRVETEPGIKSFEKMQSFIHAVISVSKKVLI